MTEKPTSTDLKPSDLAAAEAAAELEAAAEASATSARKPRMTRPRARTAGPGTTPEAQPAPPAGANDAAASVADARSTDRPSGHIEIIESGRDLVSAESVSVSQGGINEVNAGSVSVRQGGVGRATADDISVTMGGVGAARAERISVELGGVGAAMANEVRVSQGYLGPTLAREVHLEQAFARSVVAGRASFGDRSGAIVVLAGRVDGSVRTLLDWRGALAFGAAFGLVAGLVRRARR
jgi:hypothetical protein